MRLYLSRIEGPPPKRNAPGSNPGKRAKTPKHRVLGFTFIAIISNLRLILTRRVAKHFYVSLIKCCIVIIATVGVDFGGVTIIRGDELWIYYIGFAGDENHAGESWFTNGIYRNGATGIAKLRRDGFVSLNGKGTITTRKLEFSNKCAMYVNAIGSVSAEILDENGNVLDTSSVFCGDSTKAELKFSKLNIKTLNDKILRIKFTVDGKIFSFGFTDENGDFGGAHAAGVFE